MVGVEVGSPGPAVRFRPDGFAGSALRLNTRRCDKPTLYSNDPAPGRPDNTLFSFGGESLPLCEFVSPGHLVHGWRGID